MNKINERLDNLKFLIEIPRLYIANYFQELRNRIDILAAERCFNPTNEKNKHELNVNWAHIIKKIDLFENESLRKMPSNTMTNATIAELVNEALVLINQIETNKADLDEIVNFEYEKALNNIEKKLNRIFFLNRTILFLERKDCKIPQLFSKMNMNTSFGKLIIIINKYYTSDDLSFILKNESK